MDIRLLMTVNNRETTVIGVGMQFSNASSLMSGLHACHCIEILERW